MIEKPTTRRLSQQASEDLWDDLFGAGAIPATDEAAPDEDNETRTTQGWVAIERLDDNPFQPRAFINPARLQGLIKTMDEQGQLQPVLARPHPTRAGRFQLCDGHRRKATVSAGANAGIKQGDPNRFIGHLLIHVQPMTDGEMLDGAWTANEAREDFSVFDKARYYESLRLLETQRVAPERLNPDSNAPSRGAAQTADGLLSWEELVAVRFKAGKPIPGARTLRNIAAVLKLGDITEHAISQINLAPEEETANGNFQSITEKHCRALLLLKGSKRAELLGQIAAEKLSANETLARAQAMQPAKAATKEEPAAPNAAPSGTSSGDAPAQSSVGQNLGASDGENSSGVAPASSGSGLISTGPTGATSRSVQTEATGAPPEQSEEVSGDIVAAYLTPARERVKQANAVYKMLKTGPEYRDRAIEALAELELSCRQLRHELEAGKTSQKKEEEKSESRPPSAVDRKI